MNILNTSLLERFLLTSFLLMTAWDCCSCRRCHSTISPFPRSGPHQQHFNLIVIKKCLPERPVKLNLTINIRSIIANHQKPTAYSHSPASTSLTASALQYTHTPPHLRPTTSPAHHLNPSTLKDQADASGLASADEADAYGISKLPQDSMPGTCLQ